MNTQNGKENSEEPAVDFGSLYDNLNEYTSRRVEGSYEQHRIKAEVGIFKIPNLVHLLPAGYLPNSVIEIGCATGELIASFPVAKDGTRVGIDISQGNINAAKQRYPDISFYAGDVRDFNLPYFDCVVLSDVLEHVIDDVGLLKQAGALGKYLLVNIPLEDNWLNAFRKYGITDQSGHLRRYNLEQGLRLFNDSSLEVLRFNRVWVHETRTLDECRELRRRLKGTSYSGGPVVRFLKHVIMTYLGKITPLARRAFSSNLFAMATKR